MVLLDLLGRRMALRVLWELSSTDAALTFRDLQSAADTNPSVLNTRLRELREANLIMRDEDGYRLTAVGRSLSSHMVPLHKYAETWATTWNKSAR
jgi:DNA-binding HxlR family transcriptional regulator